jgi:hypothetical protein
MVLLELLAFMVRHQSTKLPLLFFQISNAFADLPSNNRNALSRFFIPFRIRRDLKRNIIFTTM